MNDDIDNAIRRVAEALRHDGDHDAVEEILKCYEELTDADKNLIVMSAAILAEKCD